MPASSYVEENGSAAMLAAKRLAGVTPEVNLLEYMCNTYTSTECENKTAHSNIETQRRHHQKSKTKVSVAPQKDLCPPKFFFKKNVLIAENLEWNTSGKEKNNQVSKTFLSVVKIKQTSFTLKRLNLPLYKDFYFRKNLFCNIQIRRCICQSKHIFVTGSSKTKGPK